MVVLVGVRVPHLAGVAVVVVAQVKAEGLQIVAANHPMIILEA